jgi:hypothetical protein
MWRSRGVFLAMRTPVFGSEGYYACQRDCRDPRHGKGSRLHDRW